MLLYAKVADAMQADQIRLTVLGIKESNPSNIFTNSVWKRDAMRSQFYQMAVTKRRLQERSHEGTNTNDRSSNSAHGRCGTS